MGKIKAAKNSIIVIMMLVLIGIFSASFSFAFSATSQQSTLYVCKGGTAQDIISVYNNNPEQIFINVNQGDSLTSTWSKVAPHQLNLGPFESTTFTHFITPPINAKGEYDSEILLVGHDGEALSLPQKIVVDDCLNMDVNIEKYSFSNCPCTPTVYEFKLTNTADYADTFDLSVNLSEKYYTISQSPILIGGHDTVSVFVYVTMPCDVYGNYAFEFKTESKTSSFVTKTPFYLSLRQDCYDFDVAFGDKSNLADNNTQVAFDPLEGSSYGLCYDNDYVLPFKLQNKGEIRNDYFFTHDLPKFMTFNMDTTRLYADGSEYGYFYAYPKGGDLGTHNAYFTIATDRGNITKQYAVDATVTVCEGQEEPKGMSKIRLLIFAVILLLVLLVLLLFILIKRRDDEEVVELKKTERKDSEKEKSDSDDFWGNLPWKTILMVAGGILLIVLLIFLVWKFFPVGTEPSLGNYTNESMNESIDTTVSPVNETSVEETPVETVVEEPEESTSDGFGDGEEIVETSAEEAIESDNTTTGIVESEDSEGGILGAIVDFFKTYLYYLLFGFILAALIVLLFLYWDEIFEEDEEVDKKPKTKPIEKKLIDPISKKTSEESEFPWVYVGAALLIVLLLALLWFFWPMNIFPMTGVELNATNVTNYSDDLESELFINATLVPEDVEEPIETPVASDDFGDSLETEESEEQLVGGDVDEYGCIPSAGFTWCEESQECYRPWEKNCTVVNEDKDGVLEAVEEESRFTGLPIYVYIITAFLLGILFALLIVFWKDIFSEKEEPKSKSRVTRVVADKQTKRATKKAKEIKKVSKVKDDEELFPGLDWTYVLIAIAIIVAFLGLWYLLANGMLGFLLPVWDFVLLYKNYIIIALILLFIFLIYSLWSEKEGTNVKSKKGKSKEADDSSYKIFLLIIGIFLFFLLSVLFFFTHVHQQFGVEVIPANDTVFFEENITLNETEFIVEEENSTYYVMRKNTVKKVDFGKYIKDSSGAEINITATPAENLSIEVEGTKVFFVPDRDWFGKRTITVIAQDQFGSRTYSPDITVVVLDREPWYKNLWMSTKDFFTSYFTTIVLVLLTVLVATYGFLYYNKN